ncbi:MAG: hypothetical protein RR202_07600 [Bacteroidales bacterium]
MKHVIVYIIFLITLFSCEEKSVIPIYDLGRVEYEVLKVEEKSELSNWVEIDNLNSSSETIHNLELPSKLYFSYQYIEPYCLDSIKPTLINIPKYNAAGTFINMTKNKYQFRINHSEKIDSDNIYQFQVIVPKNEKYIIEIYNNGISIEGKFKALLNGLESKEVEGKWLSIQFVSYTVIIRDNQQEVVMRNTLDIIDNF